MALDEIWSAHRGPPSVCLETGEAPTSRTFYLSLTFQLRLRHEQTLAFPALLAWPKDHGTQALLVAATDVG